MFGDFFLMITKSIVNANIDELFNVNHNDEMQSTTLVAVLSGKPCSDLELVGGGLHWVLGEKSEHGHLCGSR